MPFRVAIVDDNAIILQKVFQQATLLANQLACPCSFDCYSSVMNIDTEDYDAYLLDISLPHMDGVSFAQHLRSTGVVSPILFITSYNTRVFETFQVQPLFFIRKDHLEVDLPNAIGILCRHLVEFGSRTLNLQSQGQMLHIPLHRIMYVESDTKYQVIHTTNCDYEVRLSMRYFEDVLRNQGFVRIHKSYIVNIALIDCISGMEVCLSNGKTLPISKFKLKEVKLALEKVIFGC